MIAIKKLKDLDKQELNRLLHRFGDDFSSTMINTVIPIVNKVRKDGDQAVKKYTEKFDKIKLSSLLVTEEEIEKAYLNTPVEVVDAFKRAKENIEEFHMHQRRNNFAYSRTDGTTLGIQFEPIESVGLYVPGGKASYPSSVLMGAIPAKIAGSKEITVITPPNRSGNVPDIVLAVCRLLDLKNILKSGGAHGISAAAFGTESVKKVNIIVGPGNIYVTAAKSYLFSLGVIQIDSMAGPSEVLIIADDSADPKWVAFDLLSQAEHEEMATAVLVTTSAKLANSVKEEISKDINSGKGRYEIKKKAIAGSIILLVESIDEAINFSNSYAPEHMEFMIPNPLDYLSKIKNVGSLFMGNYAPVAVGDYFSGTNHILPTGGAARFSSGVGVDTFTRKTTFQYLTSDALYKAKQPVDIMSRIEGFQDKHGGSVDVRFEKD